MYTRCLLRVLVLTGILVAVLGWSGQCQAQRLYSQTTLLGNDTGEDVYVYYRYYQIDARWHGPLIIRSGVEVPIVGSRSELFIAGRSGASTYLGIVDVGALQRFDPSAKLIIEPSVTAPSLPPKPIAYRLRVLSRRVYWR